MVAKFSHGVTFWVRFACGNVYTQCVTLHTVCNFTHFVQMFVNMSIVLCDGNLREQFVSQIYKYQVCTFGMYLLQHHVEYYVQCHEQYLVQHYVHYHVQNHVQYYVQ